MIAGRMNSFGADRALTDAKQPILWTILRPTGMKIASSLVAAIFIGGTGMVLYAQYVSFGRSDNLFAVTVAYAMCWPIVLVAMTKRDFSHAYDLYLVLWPFGWLALSIYYYLLISLVGMLRQAAPDNSNNDES
jgi:hypothetical protein